MIKLTMTIRYKWWFAYAYAVFAFNARCLAAMDCLTDAHIDNATSWLARNGLTYSVDTCSNDASVNNSEV